MPIGFSGKIEGVEAVVKTLQQLDAKLRKKTLRKAVGEASKLLLAEAKRRVPEDTKTLKKSLGRKVKVMRNSGIVVAIVGPRTGWKRAVARGRVEVVINPTKYGPLVERGTAKMAARAFLKPAFEATKDQMARVITETIAQAIEGTQGN